MSLDLNQDVDYTLFSTIKRLGKQGIRLKYDSKVTKDEETIEH
jgi:hypothetical protein